MRDPPQSKVVASESKFSVDHVHGHQKMLRKFPQLWDQFLQRGVAKESTSTCLFCFITHHKLTQQITYTSIMAYLRLRRLHNTKKQKFSSE